MIKYLPMEHFKIKVALSCYDYKILNNETAILVQLNPPILRKCFSYRVFQIFKLEFSKFPSYFQLVRKRLSASGEEMPPCLSLTSGMISIMDAQLDMPCVMQAQHDKVDVSLKEHYET